MNKKEKNKFNFNKEYQNFFNKSNSEIINILYSEKYNLNYSILNKNYKNIKIDNFKKKLEFFQIYYFLLIVKSGYISPIKIVGIYKNFPNYINDILEKNKSKKIKNFEVEIKKLIDSLDVLNDKILAIIYTYIFSFEKNINYLINSKLIIKYLNIFEMKFKNSLKNKILSIQEKNIDIKEEKNIFLKNSKIINKLYFAEKILILKYLWNNNYLNIDELIKRNFINKLKVDERMIFFKKRYPLCSDKEINNKIWEYFISRLQITNQYRNKISHLNDLLIDKNCVEDLLNYFYGQYDLLKNDYTIEVFYKMKIAFLKNNLISHNKILRNHYKDFFNFKISKNKNKKMKQPNNMIASFENKSYFLNSHN